MTTQSLHTKYMETSPYYAAIVRHYGRSVSIPVAECIARDHSDEIARLVADGEVTLRADGKVGSLSLALSLGY